MSEKVLLTEQGLREREEELSNLKNVRRKEIAQKIKEAREQGDLSENAEYDAAKDEQRDIELRIEELENMLKNVEVIADSGDTDTVSVGCTITILDCEFDEELTYQLVGSTEADSLNNRISNESPVGNALLGTRVGDLVDVETPAGMFQYKVLNIQRV